MAGVFAAQAADWPQWRGPDRTDVSKETGLLHTWPEGGPEAPLDLPRRRRRLLRAGRRRRDLLHDGSGRATRSISTRWIRKQLKKDWSAEIGPVFSDGHGDGPRGTPDGGRRPRLRPSAPRASWSASTAAGGGVVWRKNLKTDLGGEMWSEWGYSESPLVDGDQVVCTPGGKNGTLAALDKKTGEVLLAQQGLDRQGGLLVRGRRPRSAASASTCR